MGTLGNCGWFGMEHFETINHFLEQFMYSTSWFMILTSLILIASLFLRHSKSRALSHIERYDTRF